MPILYEKLAKSIALRANQLTDSQVTATLEAAYAATGNLASIMEGMELPYTALKQEVLAQELVIATMIGECANALLRRSLAYSSSVESGADIPTYAGAKSAGIKYLGKFDGLFNEASDLPLTLMGKHIVMRQIRNVGGFYKVKHDCYCIEGTRVYYSCTDASLSDCGCETSCNCDSGTAYFRGVAFSPTAASTAFTANGSSVLPDQVEPLWRNMVLANLAQENWFQNAAGGYAQQAAQNAQDIGLIMQPAAFEEVLMTTKENENAQSENR